MKPNSLGGATLTGIEGEVVFTALQGVEPPVDPAFLEPFCVDNNVYELDASATTAVAEHLRTLLEQRPNSLGLKELVNVRLLSDQLQEQFPASR